MARVGRFSEFVNQIMNPAKNYFQKDGVEFEEDEFGLFTDKTTGQTNPVRRFTWRNSSRVSVQVITYGATITSMKIPDKNGTIDDIVMGFNNMDGNDYFYLFCSVYITIVDAVQLFLEHPVLILKRSSL